MVINFAQSPLEASCMLRCPDSPNSEVDTILRNKRTRFEGLPRLAAVVLGVAALAISPLATQAFGVSEKTLTPIYRHER